MEEIWKTVAENNKYQVSNLGRVRSLDQVTNDGRNILGRILKPNRLRSGYFQISLGRGKKRYVHRIVCIAFHGAPKDNLEVAHLDGNSANNRAENLTWATHSENEQHKIAHGTYARPRVFKQPHHKKRGPKTSKHPRADEIIFMRKSGASLKQVADAMGMSKSGAYNALKERC